MCLSLTNRHGRHSSFLIVPCRPLRSTLCTIQLFRVDWQREADAAVAQQRTIETLEAGIAAGGDPELLLEAAEAEDVLQSGAETGRSRTDNF